MADREGGPMTSVAFARLATDLGDEVGVSADHGRG